MKINLFLSLSLLVCSGCFSSIAAEKSLAKDRTDWFSSGITDNFELSDNSIVPDEMMTRARDLTHDEIVTACGQGQYAPALDYIFNTMIVNATGIDATVTVSYQLNPTRPQRTQKTLTIPTGGVWVLPLAGKRSLKTGNLLYSIQARVGATVGGQQVAFNPGQPVPGGLFILKRPDIGTGYCFAGPVYEKYYEVLSDQPAGFYTATFVNATGTGLQLDIYNGGGSCASIKSKKTDFPDGAYAQIDTLDKCRKGCEITRVSNRTNGSPGVVIYGGPGVCNGVFVFNSNEVSAGRDRYVLYPAMSFPVSQ